MNKELFWNELTEESKEMVREWLSRYNGSDGVAGRVFELYEEGANSAGMSLDEYLDEITPNDYVKLCYEDFLEREEHKNNF